MENGVHAHHGHVVNRQFVFCKEHVGKAGTERVVFFSLRLKRATLAVLSDACEMLENELYSSTSFAIYHDPKGWAVHSLSENMPVSPPWYADLKIGVPESNASIIIQLVKDIAGPYNMEAHQEPNFEKKKSGVVKFLQRWRSQIINAISSMLTLLLLMLFVHWLNAGPIAECESKGGQYYGSRLTGGVCVATPAVIELGK